MKSTSVARALILIAVAVAVSPARAQEYAVTRRSFTFFDSNLDIDIQATAAGQLQIVRGERGKVEVAAHAAEGIASFGLASEQGSVLTLTALGTNQAEYIVVVPEETAVRVRVPGRASWSSASGTGTARFRWDAIPEPHPNDYSIPNPTIENKYYLIGVKSVPPARVRVLGRSHVRSVELRLEGTDFQVGSTRALMDMPGAADLMDIDAGNTDVDLMIQVPAFTKHFELRLENDILVTIENGVVADRCGPSLRQTTPRGTQRVTYRPSQGVTCGR